MPGHNFSFLINLMSNYGLNFCCGQRPQGSHQWEFNLRPHECTISALVYFVWNCCQLGTFLFFVHALCTWIFHSVPAPNKCHRLLTYWSTYNISCIFCACLTYYLISFIFLISSSPIVHLNILNNIVNANYVSDAFLVFEFLGEIIFFSCTSAWFNTVLGWFFTENITLRSEPYVACVAFSN
jgi:hypothetical protein